MEIVVDKTKCIGSALCTAIAPGAFKVSEEDGKSVVYNIEGEPVSELQRAVDACPTQALSWKVPPEEKSRGK